MDDVEDAEIANWLNRGFAPTTDPEHLADIDIFIICVPAPLTKAGGPDLSAVEAATPTIKGRLTEQTDKNKPLVILESTTYPGTTEEIIRPILEKNGSSAGIDFHLAFHPERIDPDSKPSFAFALRGAGNKFEGITRIHATAIPNASSGFPGL